MGLVSVLVSVYSSTSISRGMIRDRFLLLTMFTISCRIGYDYDRLYHSIYTMVHTLMYIHIYTIHYGILIYTIVSPG